MISESFTPKLSRVIVYDYLSNAVDFLLVRLCDVEDAAVGQGDGCGPLQHGLHRPLPKSVLYTGYLAVHGTARHDSNLKTDEI